jgi:hypothetical protein
MSSPRAFSGDAAASTSSGRPERPAEGGKDTSDADSAPEDAAAAEAASQAVSAGGGGAGAVTQPPASAAVMDASDQQPHALHPATRAAAGVQQQPPTQEKEPQSKGDAQTSPGNPATQAPVCTAHALHPARTAVGEQHAPPRHAPLAQEAPLAHSAPGCALRGKLAAGEGLAWAERAGEEDAAGKRERARAEDCVAVVERERKGLAVGERDAVGEHELSTSDVTLMRPPWGGALFPQPGLPDVGAVPALQTVTIPVTLQKLLPPPPPAPFLLPPSSLSAPPPPPP